MHAAVEMIPSVLLTMAMRSDTLFWSLGVLAIAMYCLRVIENIILWPYVHIRKTILKSDAMVIEYYSATCAALLTFFCALRGYSALIILSAGMLAVVQFYTLTFSTSLWRATANVYASGFWLCFSIIVAGRFGFLLAHVFILPLVFMCCLAICIHIYKEENGTTA